MTTQKMDKDTREILEILLSGLERLTDRLDTKVKTDETPIVPTT